MRRESLAVAFVLSCSSGFAAQADVPSNPNILQSIQQLQLNEAQQTAILQAIQTALQPPTVGNVLVTPMLATAPAAGAQNLIYGCTVTNISTTPKTVLVEILGTQGQNLSPVAPIPHQIPAEGSFVSNHGGNVASLEPGARCWFTVQDGTKKDVIGSITRNILTLGSVSGNIESSTSLPAQ